ncbi:hypothetical protein EZJ43_01080 [Pedobacter changchengzhani]|uniref:Alpha-1,2-fucosyltransferase n=1 Tax=Pedobacter changchengzhani TaxID=2529274 RepID=A0A4R5MPT2_9SPHI|nr:alpha-1,2-fucosyltransferase [Pedobacter changchengzhani]TDG37718.1 hypothetical protein EZJ43_01080 [Pedobacter changchengzhani]
MNSKLIVYPKLPSLHHFIIRFRGAGLANCLFIYARALVLANKYQLKIINPSWVQFNLGPYLRKEKDKRHYNGLFKSFGIGHVKKNWLLFFGKKYGENQQIENLANGLIVVEGLGNYFEDIKNHSEMVKKHLLSIVTNQTINSYHSVVEEFVGVHIRMGDYDLDSRISLDWYLEKMRFIHEKCDRKIKFLVFSDGNADELQKVLSFPCAEMAFFGNAIADILVLSKAKIILASDSTFSAWGAYLGQTPILFNKRHFPPVLDNSQHEWVENIQQSVNIEKEIKAIFSS